MELFHKLAWDVLALIPEPITRGFRHPDDEHQGSKDELSVVWKLDAENPMSYELPGRMLCASPFLVGLYQRIVVKHFLLRIGKTLLRNSL
jgi:hypothetical protein